MFKPLLISLLCAVVLAEDILNPVDMFMKGMETAADMLDSINSGLRSRRSAQIKPGELPIPPMPPMPPMLMKQ